MYLKIILAFIKKWKAVSPWAYLSWQRHCIIYAGAGVRIPDTPLFTLKKWISNHYATWQKNKENEKQETQCRVTHSLQGFKHYHIGSSIHAIWVTNAFNLIVKDWRSPLWLCLIPSNHRSLCKCATQDFTCDVHFFLVDLTIF